MESVNLKHILTEFDKTNEVTKSIELTLLDAMREACLQTIDLCAETQAAEYKSIGLTNSGKRVNDVILKLKESIL